MVGKLVATAVAVAGMVGGIAAPASAHFLSGGNGCKADAVGTMWVRDSFGVDRNGDHVVCIYLRDGSIVFADNNFNPRGNPPAWGRTG